MFKIHTAVAGAQIIRAIGEVCIVADWRKSKNQTAMERAILVPMECVKAPDCDEGFRALVESALLETASLELKKFVNENPNVMEVEESKFTRSTLVDVFLSRNESWLTSASLEQEWNKSATWQRISGREEFKTNATYQRAASAFRDTVLKLAGKAFYLKAEGNMGRDVILAKLEDSDLETGVGQFIVRRFEMMARQDAKANEDMNLDAL